MAGEIVEVWCPTTGRWVSGYQVREFLPDGSVIVGLPGGPSLPVALASDDVRPANLPAHEEWRPLHRQRGWRRR